MNTYTVTSSRNSGEGTLRAAIALANQTEGKDIIEINVDNIELEEGLLISDLVEVKGNDVTITQTGDASFFFIDDSNENEKIEAVLADMTLTGGESPAGGAIFTREDLTLNHVTIREHRGNEVGGGVFALGSTLIINDSVFENITLEKFEEEPTQGSAIYAFDESDVTINNSIFRNNEAEFSTVAVLESNLSLNNSEITGNLGKGIVVAEGSATLNNVLVDDNDKGGVFTDESVLVIDNSTISNNSGQFGAGLEIESSNADITNTIIENNVAEEAGGGISVAFSGITNIVNSQITGNAAPIGSAIERYNGGNVNISDSLVTNNTGSSKNTFGAEIEFSGADDFEGEIGYQDTLNEPPAAVKPILEESEINDLPAVVESLEVQENSILETMHIHRSYNNNIGVHMFTLERNEDVQFKREETSFAVLSSNRNQLTGETITAAQPIYQFFNSDTQAYLYTMDENEVDYINENLDNYSLEDVTMYGFEERPSRIDTIPIYRLLNTETGTHLFTTSADEIASIQTHDDNFRSEGTAFYAIEVQQFLIE